jgi:dynein heavy chain
MATLKEKQDELQAVQDRLAKLQGALDEKVWLLMLLVCLTTLDPEFNLQLQEKGELEAKVALCAQKLQRAQKLIGKLVSEHKTQGIQCIDVPC